MANRLLPYGLLPGIAFMVTAGSFALDQTKDDFNQGALKQTVLPYPSTDSYLGEALYPQEQALAQEIGLVIEKTIRKEYRPGSARRDAHPKAHGCVKAEFRLMDKFPEHLAKGIFVPGKTYQAWIRFSNGSKNATRADSKGDARGMAIKVLGVTGKKLGPAGLAGGSVA